MKSNKISIPLVVFVLLLIFGSVYMFSKNKDESGKLSENNQPKTSTSNQNNTEPTAIPEPTDKAPVKGVYVDYSADNLSSIKGKRILFFHAPWCPQCRKLESSIQSGEIPSNVTILKVDYDSNQKLRQKYGVTIQTTLVLIDDNGNEIKKFVAYDEPTLESLKKNLL